MLKNAALVFGIVFIALGILGFVPGITTGSINDGMLLGIFHVNVVHDIIHIASGIVALFMMGNAKNAKLYFQIFGVVYLLVTILGFLMYNSTDLLVIVAINPADDYLHLVIAAVTLYLGFATKELATA
jgi:hypothetical protein